MIVGGFHPYQLFIIDTAGILMKMETDLVHFVISVDKYHSHKVSIWLIKLISWYCCFGLWKFQQLILKRKAVVLKNNQAVMWTWFFLSERKLICRNTSILDSRQLKLSWNRGYSTIKKFGLRSIRLAGQRSLDHSF